MENWCYQCTRYVYWEDATDDHPVCRTEEAMALTALAGDEAWPSATIETLDAPPWHRCRLFECKTDKGEPGKGHTS